MVRLERSEVLIGFAMSILLLFMGFDLISHNAGHYLEGIGDHEPHHDHEHGAVSARSVYFVSSMAIVSTLISAMMLENHARIAKAMRFASITFLPRRLNNPSHLLTISCSAMLLVMPLLTVDAFGWYDQAMSTAMAMLMCLLGYELVKTLGAMLLMSYSGGGVNEVLQDIEKDPAVRAVEEAKFWQVHYGLCMANLRLRVQGTEESLSKLRGRITSLVKSRLGGTGSSGQNWEVSTQLILEKE